MSDTVRVQLERGKRAKRTVASAFDWPGWDRFAKTEDGALAILEAYRSRYARVAALAGLAEVFSAADALEVVARVEGNAMTDMYGTPGRAAAPELEQMSDGECERKVALLRATWAYFDDVAGRVTADLREGPRGGGRDRERITRHANGAEIHEYAPKVGVKVPLETRERPDELRDYRDAFCDAIRQTNARGAAAGSWWTLQFLIRRCAYHMLDHAWEMEDRDLSD